VVHSYRGRGGKIGRGLLKENREYKEKKETIGNLHPLFGNFDSEEAVDHELKT